MCGWRERVLCRRVGFYVRMAGAGLVSSGRVLCADVGSGSCVVGSGSMCGCRERVLKIRPGGMNVQLNVCYNKKLSYNVVVPAWIAHAEL